MGKDDASQAASGRSAGLRNRAALVLGLVAILFPAAGGFWVNNEARSALAAKVREGQAATARAIAEQSHQGVEHAVEVARQAAKRPGLISYLQSGDVVQQTRVLENVRSTGPFRGLGIFANDGRPTARAGQLSPELTTVAPSNAQDAAVPKPRNGDALLAVREPIVGDSGSRIGLLVAEVSLVQAVRGVTDLRFGRTGTATLVDKGGQVLVTGEPLREGRTLTASQLLELVRQDRPGTAEYYGTLVRREEIAAFTPVEGRAWGVLVTQATAEAFAPVDHLSRLVILGVVVLVGLGVVITLLVARNLSQYEQALRKEQESLARANTELTEANQTLRDFAAVAAHDLRGPIAAVVGFADTLSARWDSVSDPEKQEIMAIISRQGQHLAKLVEDLLMVSRLQAGVLQAMGQTLPLRPIIQQALEGCGQAAQSMKVSCPENLNVVADPDHLRRMVMNYATNALKYGGEPIQIQAIEENGSVEVRVRDHGPGVPDELVPRLFEKFVRGARRTEDDTSTGLGLSIVRGLAKANGGDAWYEPNEPTGSCFAFKLPRASQ